MGSIIRRLVGCASRFLADLVRRFLAHLRSFGAHLTLFPDLINLFVGEVLDPDINVLRGAGADQFIKLHLNSRIVAIL